jgi:predicted DsbA family dithiol-disulfide isomerase
MRENAMTPAVTTRLRIDIWADLFCPMCYLGEKRLDTAIDRSGLRDRIDLVVRTFELQPGASREVTPNSEYVAEKFGISVAEADAMERELQQLAAQDDLPFEIHRPKRNTYDMLRLLHLALQHGVAWDLLKTLQHRIFTGRFDAYDRDVLIAAAQRHGIPASRARDVLDSDRFAADVEADRRDGLALGLQGIPFTVLGNRFGIPGAATVQGFQLAIESTWKELTA